MLASTHWSGTVARVHFPEHESGVQDQNLETAQLLPMEAETMMDVCLRRTDGPIKTREETRADGRTERENPR